MTDIASLFVEIREFILAIKIHVVFWMDWIFIFGRCSRRGAVNRFVFVLILEQQYFWWRFYRAFSNTLGLYSACLPVSLFLTLN